VAFASCWTDESRKVRFAVAASVSKVRCDFFLSIDTPPESLCNNGWSVSGTYANTAKKKGYRGMETPRGRVESLCKYKETK
jgi:hypothetical protein